MNENYYVAPDQYSNVAVSPQQPDEKKMRDFSTLESVFAWIAFIGGYLFCRAFPVGKSPLGGFLFITMLFVITAIVLKLKGCKFKALPIVLGLSAIAMSSALIISNNGFIYFFSYSYSLVIYCYFIYAIAGNTLQRGLTDYLALDFFKAIFVTPFFAFSHLFKAMFTGKRKKGRKVVSKALLGAAFAIVPTAIVVGLLSYDENFSNTLSRIFDFEIDIFSHIVSLGFAIIIGMYVFGLFISSSDKLSENAITVDGCKGAYSGMKIAPMVTILVAAIPLLFVYVVFFISQMDYYISGFTGVLPENLSYAQYAREGFFQLCTVSVINLAIILLAVVFTKRKTEQPTLALKALTIIYSLFTLVLISTAVAKMIMYIDYYGLTQKRVYATWFMFILALVFIIIIIKQFVPSLKAVAASFVVGVVLFAGLALSSVDTRIAEYNVDRYIEGTVQDFDVVTLYELGDAAVPEMVRLYKFMDEKHTGGFISSTDSYKLEYLEKKLEARADKAKADEGGIFSFNIPSARAEAALKEIGML